MARFAVTIFLSAFLLFQVQPLIAKYILPWFGGGPAIWTTCMLFFQVLLLLGYSYAHLVSSIPARMQTIIHLTLLVGTLFLLPIIPSASSVNPDAGTPPAWQILTLLGMTVGGPYLLLSSTGPLMQRWFNTSYPGQSPYRLYALSNFGSLLALLSYPFLFEPLLELDIQATGWSFGYGVFVLAVGWCGFRFFKMGTTAAVTETNSADTSSPRTPAAEIERPSAGTMLWWIVLSACGSGMLLAATNQICLEISVVPFLWILPLSLYLITFIIAFDSPRWYNRALFVPLLALSTAAVIALLEEVFEPEMWVQIIIFSSAMFVCCMTVHGEMVRKKPDPKYLTTFYLLVALGGALGGLAVAIGAPAFFLGYWEFHLALAICVTVTIFIWIKDFAAGEKFRMIALGLPVLAVLGFMVASLARTSNRTYGEQIHVSRNFYGVLHVEDSYLESHDYRLMRHGLTTHGGQFHGSLLQVVPTAYYSPHTGAGLALREHPKRGRSGAPEEPLRVGVVGLGVGTLASYMNSTDYLRFYEINPEVERLAGTYFTFLGKCLSPLDVIIGDARIRMDQELKAGDAQNFDVLVVDAFSSDAIPVHLLTTQAADIYWRHLAEDGVLLFHITNRYLDLIPIVRGLAQHLDVECLLVLNPEGRDTGGYDADWMVLSRNKEFMELPAIQEAVHPFDEADGEPILWTDKFTSLWQVMHF